MLKQLKRRFVCVLMALVTLTLCAIFGFLYHFTRVNLEKQCVSMMESVAKNPFQLGQPGSWSESVRLPYFVIKVTARGEVTAVSGGNYDLTDTVFLDNLIDAAIHSADDLGSMPDYGLRYLKVKTPGALALVFADTTSETATLHSLAKNCLLIGAGCLAVFFGIALLLARWTARPVEKAWAQQRQFVSDASHELKTPLTVILSNAELLEQAGLSDKPARWTDNIRSEAGRMRSLVEEMLTLARADNMARTAVLTEISLSDIAADCALAFEPVAFEAGKPLDYTLAENITVLGDGDKLRQLISILLDNAIKYGADGGTVHLALEATDRQAKLTVSNPGQPIPAEQLERLFERFYRVDGSRGEKSGFGLGLPIARTIAAEHKGILKAESDAISTRFIYTMALKK